MTALGNWLDNSPGDVAFAVLCLLIGAGGLFWGLYQRAQRIDHVTRGSRVSKNVAAKNAAEMHSALERGRR